MKMKIINKAFVLTSVLGFAFLLSSAFSFSQLQQVRQDNNVNYDLHEKIFLHSDRSFYLCGEIIWFKAYLVNAASNKPFSLSKVAYVEILDKTNQPVLQDKIAMKDGLGSGSFLLPLTLASGNYKLRAYTSWMKNFPADLFFEKTITIINTSRNLDSSAIHEPVKYTAGFFPEGGNLVNGLQSIVAFKVTDNKNNGVTSSGIVIDQTGDTITHFSTLKFGMGHFDFTPQPDKQYKAIILLPDSSSVQTNLPKAYASGYVMHLSHTGLNINITVNAKGTEEANGDISLIVQNNNKVTITKSQAIINGQATFLVNKNDLQAGVSLITLFKNRQPVCERLYFKRPANKMLISANADKENYQSRSKVSVDLATTNISGSSLAGNMSVSVYRLDSMQRSTDEDIYSYLWLSSDLRGAIESPGYYFKNDNAETNEALDNLLLTQGWRTFDWKKEVTNSTPSFVYLPEYLGHIITGRITDAATGQPAPNVLVYLSVPGRRIQLKGCISDSMGMVRFDMKDFYGHNQVVMQTSTGLDQNYHYEIFSPFSEKFTDVPLPNFYVSQNGNDHLQNLNMYSKAEGLYHENDLQKLYALLIDTLPFYRHPDRTYLLDNYTRFTTMEEVMREYVAEVNVRKKGNDFHFLTVNLPTRAVMNMQITEQLFENDPLVLLDGVPVFNMNKIVAYDPLKVQKLEVVASRYYWGPITADGIVNYTTYNGNLEDYKLDSSDLIMDYEGLQQQRIFYSPDYSSPAALQSHLPDFRNVLYWSPNVNTNDQGKANFSFYTGDIPGKYLVVVQGISADGEAGSNSIILNVKK
jgi:hypothetical protein